MSTYWYFECMDHEPHLSGQEFTQHTDDDAYRKGIELAHARPLDHSWWDGDQGGNDGYFERNARHFLDGHPSCRLGVVSDYGERRDDIPGTSRAASDRAAIDLEADRRASDAAVADVFNQWDRIRHMTREEMLAWYREQQNGHSADLRDEQAGGE